MQISTGIWDAQFQVIKDDTFGEYDTELSPDDFEAALDNEPDIDLRTIGINVKPDPILGSKIEGDIAVDDLKSFIKNSNQRGRNAIRYIQNLESSLVFRHVEVLRMEIAMFLRKSFYALYGNCNSWIRNAWVWCLSLSDFVQNLEFSKKNFVQLL